MLKTMYQAVPRRNFLLTSYSQKFQCVDILVVELVALAGVVTGGAAFDVARMDSHIPYAFHLT